MTEQRVRELLTDVADPVPPPDLAERAWRRSVRVRRRRMAGTAMLTVGAVVAVLAVVGLVGDAQPGSQRPDDQVVAPQPPPVPEAAEPRQPEAHVAGAPAWIGPSLEEEERLPRTASFLPETIDLSADVETTEPPGRTVAALASSDSEHQLREVMLVGRAGQVSRLDVSDLDLDLVERPLPDGDHGYVLPLNISSLSPDGKSLVLAQNDEVVLYDLVTGEYQRWPTPDAESYYVGWTLTEDRGWQIQLVEELMDPDTGEIDYRPEGDGESADDGGPVAVWPLRTSPDGRTAQAWVDRPVPKLESEIGDDPVLIEVDGTRPAMLALPMDEGDHVSPRSRVVAWLGGDVVFQSQDYGTFRVLGWDPETGAVRSLTEVELPDDWDEGVAASWAEVPR
jgi:hypothetical protein